MSSLSTNANDVLPKSPYYQLRDTPGSGRGVFATTTIPPNTLLLNTGHQPNNVNSSSIPTSPITPLSPLAWLIQRPYRKEACAHCFAYNRGRDWKLKIPSRDCGVVFCSESCRNAWIDWNGEVGIQAWEALEAAVKALLKRSASAVANGVDNDTDMPDVDGGAGKESGGRSERDPSAEEIEKEWRAAELIGEIVLSTKQKVKPSKNERKVVNSVVERGGDPDLMYYLLTAVMSAYNIDKQLKGTQEQATEQDMTGDVSTPSNPNTDAQPKSPTNTIEHSTISTLLSPLFTLTPTLSAYKAAHTSLPLLSASYLYLQHHLPTALTPYLTPPLAHNLNTRAAHNAFSIRPSPSGSGTSDGTDSGEFIGWGVWPSASFFNHSCAPNVVKVRRGRDWAFRSIDTKEVEGGEELCITYLGGEERDLDVQERKARLLVEWGFVCCCGRCETEGALTINVGMDA